MEQKHCRKICFTNSNPEKKKSKNKTKIKDDIYYYKYNLQQSCQLLQEVYKKYI